ncbi:MAG TPA: hypothetical protein DCW72_09075 [Elusimicrobia bacterium]|nr:MAG: hypothetical protein A2X29_06200 [Elusimicrobia bacterium GWA2_64_40]OGR64102.1 MAG: hypothetical protein A2X30_12550 [Elusimicrobia bacterium GWB2_63_16]HAN05788.1 hypothetical protein [Elusimicrobiota bacterium]HAU90347.1 hypothetical protein [Elusimicrobiota bacterium]
MAKILLAVLVLAALARPSAAADPSVDALAGSPVFSDQAFQDFVETVYGYKGPAGDALRAPAYRDAVAAPAPVPKKGAYVYVSILPRLAGGAALAAELERSAGFILTGRRYLVSGGVKRVRLNGWVKAWAVEALRYNPGVAGLRVGFAKPPAAAL